MDSGRLACNGNTEFTATFVLIGLLMFYATLKTVHVLAITVWIGGMVFAHFFLRPALAQLERPVRLRLMHEVLGRFFHAVLAAALLTLVTGVWMLGRVAKQVVQSGGSFAMPPSWIVMTILGLAMVGIFLYVRLVLFRRFSGLVATSDWTQGEAVLARIRRAMLLNLGAGAAILIVMLMRLTD